MDEAWWRLREPQKVVQLLREVGISKLANWDGCICSRFSIRNVDVDISCGKGRDRGVWVSSPSMDYCSIESWGDGESLDPIVEEVRDQMKDCDSRGPITVHLVNGPDRTRRIG